jgi:hypothetical protein
MAPVVAACPLRSSKRTCGAQLDMSFGGAPGGAVCCRQPTPRLAPPTFNLSLENCPGVPNSRWLWDVPLPLCGKLALDLVEAAQDQGGAVDGGHGGGRGPSSGWVASEDGASWQSRLNSAPPGSAVWEKWEEKHSPQHIKGRTLLSRSDLVLRLVHLRQRFVD